MDEKWALKIYTKDGIAKNNIFGGLKVLHLGCGHSKLNGAIGVDILNLPEVDVACNLNILPWPFDNHSVDLFFAHNSLEHLDNIVDFFNEVWRIGKNGSRIIIAVPYFRHIDSFTDPTHKIFFTSHSLDYFLDKKTSLSNYNYSFAKFRKVDMWYGWPGDSKNFLVRMFKKFIKRNENFYDQYLSLFFPVKILVWELEIIK